MCPLVRAGQVEYEVMTVIAQFMFFVEPLARGTMIVLRTLQWFGALSGIVLIAIAALKSRRWGREKLARILDSIVVGAVVVMGLFLVMY